MARLLRAIGKYLWLIILVIIIFVCVINEFPSNYALILKPGVVFPNGIITNSEGRYYESFFMFVEKPNFREPNNKISASNPKEVNSYLEKIEKYTKEYEAKLFPEIKKINRILPVSSEGKDRILILGGSEEYNGLFMFDTQYKLLHKNAFCCSTSQWFVSANFTDRLWAQDGCPASFGFFHMYEISIANDKIDIKKIDYGSEHEYPTYKIMNHRTNPRMVLYQKAYAPLIYWFLYFLLFLSLILVLGLFLISRKH
jgi:hypothetical protein